jgi:hypothetical protein
MEDTFKEAEDAAWGMAVRLTAANAKRKRLADGTAAPSTGLDAKETEDQTLKAQIVALQQQLADAKREMAGMLNKLTIVEGKLAYVERETVMDLKGKLALAELNLQHHIEAWQMHAKAAAEADRKRKESVTKANQLEGMREQLMDERTRA